MIYDCYAIPGCINGQYSAILSDDGISYLNKLNTSIKSNDIVISLITGNYITIDNGVLWRGDCHGDMKNAYIENSDYVFILSPLGKVLKLSLVDLNNIIKDTTIPLASVKIYNSLMKKNGDKEDPGNNPENIKKLLPKGSIKSGDGGKEQKEVYLITTKRTAKQNSCYPPWFLNYFNDIHIKLCGKLTESHVIAEDFSPDIDSDEVIHQLHIYDRQYMEAFFNYEFPHPEIRKYMKDKMETL